MIALSDCNPCVLSLKLTNLLEWTICLFLVVIIAGGPQDKGVKMNRGMKTEGLTQVRVRVRTSGLQQFIIFVVTMQIWNSENGPYHIKHSVILIFLLDLLWAAVCYERLNETTLRILWFSLLYIFAYSVTFASFLILPNQLNQRKKMQSCTQHWDPVSTDLASSCLPIDLWRRVWRSVRLC